MTNDWKVQRAVELDDLQELRRLADAGNDEAVDALVEIAGERADIEELRRLAAAGSAYAGEILTDLAVD
jgi:hypothetical protein